MADTYYYFNSAHLHFDGTHASTTFTDSSFRAKTWTAAGNAQLTTTAPKFGTASGTFDGTGDNINTGSHDDFGFGTGPFTVEGWINQAASTATRCLFDSRTAGNTGIAIMSSVASPSTSQSRLCAISNTAQIAGDGSTAFTSSTWQHWAVTRDESNTLRGFIDGVQVWSVTDARTYASASTAYIGAYYDGSQSFFGKLDEIRVTKGYARYTANFTPPTEAFDDTVPDLNTGDADLLIDPFALEANGVGYADIEFSIQFLGYGGANADLVLSDFTLVASAGGFTDLQLDPFTLVANGRARNNRAELDLSDFTLAAIGGGLARMAIDAFTLEATGTVTNIGHGALALDDFTLEASGTVTFMGIGLAVKLAPFTFLGYGGGAADLVLDAFTLDSAGTSGTVGNADLHLGAFTLEATGFQVNYGGLDVTIGDFISGPYGHGSMELDAFTLVATGYAQVTVTYEAYAVNLKPAENMPHQVTTYTNYPFNQFIRHGNTWYGVADDGLYPIGGTTDYAATPAKIAWQWHTASTDFGSRQKKQVRETFLHGRLSDTVNARVSVGEGAQQTYAALIVRGAGGQAHRIKYGKGLKGEYWSFGMSGNGIGDIDSMQHEPAELGRKL